MPNTLSGGVAADFFQKHGHTRTAIQRKQEIADVDVNQDGRTSFIEYLVLHFKIFILEEYFQRKQMQPDVDMAHNGVGLTKVGDKLIEELFANFPHGIDLDLDKSVRDLVLKKASLKKQMEELNETILHTTAIKAKVAQQALDKLIKEDDTHVVEVRIANAIAKLEKRTIEEVKKRKAQVVATEEAKKPTRGGVKQ